MNDYAIQLYIELDYIQPKIWRRFVIEDGLNFERLHRAIQGVMGWENRHLYLFQFEDGTIVQKNEDNRGGRFDPRIPVYKSPTNNYVFSFLKVPGTTFQYIYDFGDHWVHTLKVESVTPVELDQILPVCLEGERACPPEDCGSVPGYEQILQALKQPQRKQNQALLDWLDKDFDPESFQLDKINKRLSRMRSRTD